VSIPSDLAERLFCIMYSEYELIRTRDFWIVRHDGALVASDTLSGLAQSLSELNGGPAMSDCEISAGVRMSLPRR
jgi:hypothetical protein